MFADPPLLLKNPPCKSAVVFCLIVHTQFVVSTLHKPACFRHASDTCNFLRHAMRALLSVRPKCSHRCVSLKESPLKTCANPPAQDQNINWANLYENEMVWTYRDLNCSGTGVFQTGGFPDLDLSFLFCPFLSLVLLGLSPIFFWDFPDFLGDGPGIFPIRPFTLSRPIKSTYEEQSPKGSATQSGPFPKKVGNTRVWNPPGLASLNLLLSTDIPRRPRWPDDPVTGRNQVSTTFCFSALFWSFPPKTPPHLGIENSHKRVPWQLAHSQPDKEQAHHNGQS